MCICQIKFQPTYFPREVNNAHSEPMSREEATQFLQSMDSEEPLYRELSLKLSLRQVGIIELSNGQKVNTLASHARILGGGGLDGVQKTQSCFVKMLEKSQLFFTVAMFMCQIAGVVYSLYQRIKNWFQHRGFKTDDEITAVDFQALLATMNREEQVIIAHRMGFTKI